MDRERFEKLAEEIAARDPGLPERLRGARAGAERLRSRLADAVGAFARRAESLGAAQLTHLGVSAVEADEKHTDCLQFKLERGRWVLICVAIADAPPRLRVVGPFKRGQAEKPCVDFPLESDEVETALEERALALIEQAVGE